MMTNLQYLLTKLAEECEEVGQMAHKTQQFGIDERYGDGPTNRERLHAELDDLMAAIQMLNDEEGLGYIPNRNAVNAKIAKVSHYREYSRSIGLVEGEKND